MAPVKILVVGLGNMGRSHASAYHRNPGFEIVGPHEPFDQVEASAGRTRGISAL